jgi:hypothetical protein
MSDKYYLIQAFTMVFLRQPVPVVTLFGVVAVQAASIGCVDKFIAKHQSAFLHTLRRQGYQAGELIVL